MRKIITLISLLLFFITTYSQQKFNYSRDFNTILSMTKSAEGNMQYAKLLNRFQSNDTTMTDIEMLALLIGFTDNPYYKPYEVLKTEIAISALNDDGMYKEASESASRLLATYPLSFQALEEKSFSFLKLGVPDSVNYYTSRVSQIIGAMLYSGDGETAETAFFALGPEDGQLMIKGAGLTFGTVSSGTDNYGNTVDIVGVVRGEDITDTYFNIQHAVKTK